MLTRLLTILLSLTLLVGLVVAGYLAYLNFVPAPVPAPTVELQSVQNSGTVQTISVTVRGRNLARVELWADAYLIGRETNAEPARSSAWNVSFRWTPPADGVYQLVARVFDTADQYTGIPLTLLVAPPQNKIAFSSNRSGTYTLYTMTADGATVTPLLTAPSAARYPSFSRDGALAYTSMENGAWHIRVRPAGAATATDVTPDLGSTQRPVWSADGKRIAFEVTNDNKTGIIISDPEGKNRVTLTQPAAYDGQLTFAPTNNLIAYASFQGNAWDIYTIHFDGTNVTRLTSDPAQDWQPAWSPQGDRMAFVSNRSGQQQIYLMRADGTGVTRLTDFPLGAEQPAWSFDGKWLVFVANTGSGEKDNRREVYLMSADGRGLTRLTQNAFDDTEPAWMP